MLVAACPGASRRAHSWPDAQLRGVMGLQEWPQQPEHNPKQTRKSNLVSGGRENPEIPEHSPNIDTKGKPSCQGAGAVPQSTASTDSQRLDSPAAPALLPTGTLTTCLFPGLWYEESHGWFCFTVPMISGVNCKQHIPSPSASKGCSLSWLHVPNVPLELFAFQNFCAQAVC